MSAWDRFIQLQFVTFNILIEIVQKICPVLIYIYIYINYLVSNGLYIVMVYYINDL